jgi:hypothetical protein
MDELKFAVIRQVTRNVAGDFFVKHVTRLELLFNFKYILSFGFWFQRKGIFVKVSKNKTIMNHSSFVIF